jgi:hypothetical protein
LPGWKPKEGKRGDVKMRPEGEQQLLAEFRALTDAPAVPESELRRDSDDSDFIVIQRMVPVRMGKWRILPPEVEQRENARRSAGSAIAVAVAAPDIRAEGPEPEKAVQHQISRNRSFSFVPRSRGQVRRAFAHPSAQRRHHAA